ncbi:hypothetical protein [Cytobacillus gottheilii]|uniref:hypothetical protein n=1 Tax=Cytobacillus gottheilii TaxID=859144 RepID=UPI0024946D1F|nr:hypothetical protein [Cytobacillus gottheilii]
METYHAQMNCGQISYICDFFKDYQDDHVKTDLQSSNRVQAVFSVSTELKKDDAERHLKQVFKESKFGPGLYYSIKVL